MTSVAVHVDQLWFQTPGGIGTYVRNLVPALVRRDPSLDVKLFHCRFPPREPPERWIRDFWVEELPASIKTLYPRWALTGHPPLPPGLQSADVVHATNPAAIPPVEGRQRLVVTVHDLAFELLPGMFERSWRFLYKAGLWAAVKRAHAIVTPSRNTAEDVLSRTRVDPGRLHVIPLAPALAPGTADPELVLSRLKVPQPYVLFVGTLEPRKNLVRLIRAYRRVAATGLPHALVLVGGLGWHHDALMREIALPGPGDVALTGPLSPEDLDAVYRAADVFVYPSLYEGFGLPVIEAMARGVPTVASNTSSLPEVAGEAALGVNPRSVREIAQAIEAVLTDLDLADRLSIAGRRRAERFSWDETARMTLEVYERVVGAA
ncbi:MAG TPA: glycosyltransferase family 1 protein [Actinomycetota bacterium]|nr:glycosyltransferase family 1 protein [Actinomycetota bacterium]